MLLVPTAPGYLPPCPASIATTISLMLFFNSLSFLILTFNNIPSSVFS